MIGISLLIALAGMGVEVENAAIVRFAHAPCIRCANAPGVRFAHAPGVRFAHAPGGWGAPGLAAAVVDTADSVGVGFPTEPPRLREAPAVSLPAPVARTLENGLEVLYVRRGTLPFVHATLLVRSGRTSDPPEMPGLAPFVANMLDEGAGGRDALALSAEIELLGASLGTSAGWDDSRVNLQVLRPRLAEALALMGDVAFRPDFPDREIERLRDELLTDLMRTRDEPTAIAANAFAALVFGADHPYGRLQTTDAARAYTREKLVRFHSVHYRPANAVLILAGDVDPDADHPAVERVFGTWPARAEDAAGAPAPQPIVPAAPPAHGTTIYVIDKADAPQTVVRIGHAGVSRDDPDYYAIEVMNAVLGSSFTSRLMTNLRTVHGYTYSASSSYAARVGPGPFLAGASVVTEKTDSSLVEFFRELERIREEPVSEEELQRARQYVAFGLPHDFETATQVAGHIAALKLYGLPVDYYDTYVERIMAVTAEDVQRVARRHVRPDESVVVLVGDQAQVRSQIESLDLGPVEIRDTAEFVR